MQQRLFYFGCLLLLTQLSACHMNRAQTSNQSVQKMVLQASSERPEEIKQLFNSAHTSAVFITYDGQQFNRYGNALARA